MDAVSAFLLTNLIGAGPVQFWSDIEKHSFDLWILSAVLWSGGKFPSCLVLLVKKMITVKAKAPNNVVLTAGR